MKNLNKFTKAELINKFKKLESKNSDIINSNQSLFSRIVDFILYFKSLLLKITLITILIRTIKKYSLFSKILRFANWIILSIFGISVIDNFGLGFFNNFFLELRAVIAGIITYFSDTAFYSFLASLFKTKEEVTNQKVSLRDRPVIEGASYETERSEIQNKRNSKISEWLKPEPEVKEESNKGKYLVIAGILILGCLSWYYWDEVRTVGPFVQDWFRRIRPRNDSDGGGNPGMNQGNILPSIDKPSIEQRLIDICNQSDSSPIELVDNTQKVASTSKVKLDNSPSSDNSIDHYFTKPAEVEPQLTGLKEITGNHFTSESAAVVNEIDTFLNYHDNSSFPKASVAAGLYSLLRERLHRLSEVSESRYSQLIESDEINNKIDRFVDLEKEVFANEDNENNINDGANNENIIETQSNTYDEVALANIETANVWSDRATPSVHSQVLSPASSHSNLENNQITNLVDNAEELNDNELLEAVKETFIEDVSLTSELNQQNTSINLPDINIDSNSSSDNSMNQYFTKPEEVKPTYTFADMLKSINSRRDDSNVVGSPQISQLGLSPKLSPLNTKPSISNLLDDTMGLFEDDEDIGGSISNIDKGKAREVVNENLLSTVSDAWENVQTNIQYGDNPNNIKVDLNYGSLWTRISKYRFILDNNQVIDYEYLSTGDIRSRTFDLTSKIINNTSEQVDIKEIKMLDLDFKEHSIWTNTKIFD